jgi:hypothetical protein
MGQAARNAFKGYTYQQYIYLLMVAKMDTERNIDSIEAEVDVDNNFDDISIKTDKETYMIQVKNYPNTELHGIKVVDDKVHIKSSESKLSNYTNIIIINTDKFEGDTEILGMKAVKFDRVYIVPLTSDKIKEIIEDMYMNQSRIQNIISFCYKRCVESKFTINKEDLPEIIRFTTDLEEKTILIRDTIDEIQVGVNLIIGKPGVGKSHYVREIKESIDELIIYRFWIGSQDPNIKRRLKFEEFICDISYQVFNSPKRMGYNAILEEINKKQLCIVIDGLDHVENYNQQELDLYIKFIEDINKARVLVLSRPLSHKLSWPTKYLKNWNINETIEYLYKAHGINNYVIEQRIYKITQGYPIITYFLASHYNLTNEINIVEEIEEINDYYDKLVDNIKMKISLSVFSINTGFYQKEEIVELLNNEMLSKIIFEFIEGYPYLFKINLNRISLIHDSFNTYLRKNNEYTSSTENDILVKIQKSILKGEIRYLSRFGNFEFEEKFILDVVSKYCDLDQYKYLISNTIDYESIREFYEILKSYIDKMEAILDIYKYYSLVMIMLIIERNDLIGEHNILYQLFKYMSSNNIDESDIFSNGVTWCSYLYFKNKDINPYKRLLNELNYSDTAINDLESVIIEDEQFFTYIDYYTDENIVWDKIVKGDSYEYDNRELLIEYFVLSFINKSKYYHMLANFIYKNDDVEILKEIKKICVQIGIREMFAKSVMNSIKYRLYELGVVLNNNPFIDKTLDSLIKEYSSKGSFNVNSNIVSYMRLAYRESRKFNIYDLNNYYGMYYNRKDYSVINLNKAFITLENRVGLDEMVSMSIIKGVMEQSEKGISHILTAYINMKDRNFTKKLIELGKFNDEFPVDIFDLESDRIDLIAKRDIIKRMHKALQYHNYGKSIPYYDIDDALESKYKKLILEIIEYYEYKVTEVPEDKIQLFKEIDYMVKISETDKDYSLFEKGYVIENDLEKVISSSVSPIELSKYTDGWHSCFPYIHMYEHYNKGYLNDIYLSIIHNALFTKVKGFEFTGNWRLCVGNILEFIDMIDADIDWIEIKNILFDFLEISLIKCD